MAATITFDNRTTGSKQSGRLFSGSEKVRRGTGNLGIYATNGVAVTAATFGLRTLNHVDISSATDGSTLFVWDAANGKIKAFSAVGTEVTNSTDISSKTFRFEAKGR
jgi:hypothetical protein